MEKESIFNEPQGNIVLRMTAYTLVIFCAVLLLPLFVEDGDISFFKENGPLEWLQFSLVIGAIIIFLIGARFIRQFRQVFYLLASVSAFAAIRELDNLLDALVPLIGWKFAFLIVPYVVVLLYIYRVELNRQIKYFICSRAFAMLWAGFIVAGPFAQLVGHGPFLQSLMDDNYSRDYKRVIEESGEFIGYFLILAGSIESVLQLKRTLLRDLLHSRPSGTAPNAGSY